MSWTVTPRYLGAAVSDADAQTYLRAVETADGQPLEPAVAHAVNEFVLGCKADGIWSAIKASCILAGARTLAGALVPLVGTAPTNNNFVTGDYNRKTGLVGDASTKYLDSNRNNNSSTQNNFHAALYASAVSNLTSGLITGRSSAGISNVGTSQLNWVASTGLEVRLRSGAADVVSPTTAATGFYGASRSGASSSTARRSSVTTSITTASDGLDNANLFVFARNTAGTAAIHSDWRLAFYSIGESLDLALLDARVTTLVNALSAAIP